MSPARSSTFRCLEIAGFDIWKGWDSSPTDASPEARRARIARRVGSARAEKMLLRRSVDICVTLWLFNHLVINESSVVVGQWRMATQDDVRRIALSLPETVEADGRFAFSVRDRGRDVGFAWVWAERVHPKKARVPNPAVLAVRVADGLEKELILRSDDVKFFTEPHYNGYPAVLIRLAEVDVAELEELLTNAWRYRAPRELREAYDRDRATGPPTDAQARPGVTPAPAPPPTD